MSEPRLGDVLSAVPPLPTASESVTANQGRKADGGCGDEGVQIQIAEDHVPESIRLGVRELCTYAPRRNVSFVQGAQIARAKQSASPGQWWWNVVFRQDTSQACRDLQIVPSDQDGAVTVSVYYNRPCEAFRGLGHVLGVSRTPFVRSSNEDGPRWVMDDIAVKRLLSIHEKCQFQTLGTMIDCSRNGVMRVESVKFLCRKLALMGYNMLQLYTEDTYKIEEEPFFGYLRGGYSQAELREIDDYAHSLGIEVIPCIQTLGHLGQMLQWPRFLSLRDTSEVLLADHQETYTMISKMISTATAPFRSKKIHLGMDETHGLGHGRYHGVFGQHNYKEPTRIFIDHLSRVNAICLDLGLEPCIWSDMLFCLNARNDSLLGYYDSAQPTLSVQGIPDNLDLVYWDYYHTSKESYANRIESHWKLGRKSPWMAAGSWTWSRFWTALPFTFATCKASMNASKAPSSGVTRVFLTIWGDEGNEVDLFSSLPAWSYYAEHAYERGSEVDIPRLKSSFDGICGANFDDFVMASRLDDTNPEAQSIDDRIHFAPNTSKWLLWEEPILGFVSPTVQASGLDLEFHYATLASYLHDRLSTQSLVVPGEVESPPRSLLDHPFNARLRMPQLLAKVLSLKAALRLRLHLAYVDQDWPELAALAGRGPDSRMFQLRKALRQLHNYHRQLWMSMYKPNGWEVVELRYGGLASRLETMHERVARFLDHVGAGGQVGVPRGKKPEGPLSLPDEGLMLNAEAAEQRVYEEQVDSIPELAQKLEVVYGSAEQLLDYHRVSRVTYC